LDGIIDHSGSDVVPELIVRRLFDCAVLCCNRDPAHARLVDIVVHSFEMGWASEGQLNVATKLTTTPAWFACELVSASKMYVSVVFYMAKRLMQSDDRGQLSALVMLMSHVLQCTMRREERNVEFFVVDADVHAANTERRICRESRRATIGDWRRVFSTATCDGTDFITYSDAAFLVAMLCGGYGAAAEDNTISYTDLLLLTLIATNHVINDVSVAECTDYGIVLPRLCKSLCNK
jgi:hypothetical protein